MWNTSIDGGQRALSGTSRSFTTVALTWIFTAATSANVRPGVRVFSQGLEPRYRPIPDHGVSG